MLGRVIASFMLRFLSLYLWKHFKHFWTHNTLKVDALILLNKHQGNRESKSKRMKMKFVRDIHEINERISGPGRVAVVEFAPY